jgi:uncharacterized protein YecE (DUF72 family)
MALVLIGTSGWHYDSWRGPFFPKGLPIENQLQYYASQFSTTELNGVFYRTPTPEAVKSWRDQTGNDFVFAWRASKFITHWKRLSQNSVSSLELLEHRLSLLGDKAGPILFQCRRAAGPYQGRSVSRQFRAALHAFRSLHPSRLPSALEFIRDVLGLPLPWLSIRCRRGSP